MQRINRVLDLIYSELSRQIRLNELAELADLSPFHFHRVFQAMVGETPNEFVKRLRLEKSLSLMCFGRQKSFTSIALDCGFSCSSDFTRSFKQHFGVAPSKFDLEAWRAEHGERLESAVPQCSFKVEKSLSRANPDRFRVRVRELRPRKVAYIRVDNPYQGDGVVKAAKRLLSWAEDRQWADGQWLGYQFEKPEITVLEQCRYYVAVEVEQQFKTDGEVGFFLFPAMLVAEVTMKGGLDMEIRLLQWLYGSWLPRSKYVPEDIPCFEAWSGKPFEHGFEYFELAIQLPIRQVAF